MVKTKKISRQFKKNAKINGKVLKKNTKQFKNF